MGGYDPVLDRIQSAHSGTELACRAATQRLSKETMPRTLIGMLTPSSNTILEPVTGAMLAGLPDVSAHFGRFRVTEIALSSGALAQFDNREILAAAELLSHARCEVIGWNGTSAGWLGFDARRAPVRGHRGSHGRARLHLGARAQ